MAFIYFLPPLEPEEEPEPDDPEDELDECVVPLGEVYLESSAPLL